MSGFRLLHSDVQFQIVNALGWRELRPLQERTVAPVLAGKNALVVGPTAGGKTEAALFPVVSRMLEENRRGLSVVYICPLRALLNNLFLRLKHYGQLFGRSVGLWHGDIRSSARQAICDSPPDILLTTPESLEVMLVSRRVAKDRLFSGVEALILDEVHAFLSGDRGWQLLSLCERLQCIAARDLQRIGLSATVGNAEDVLAVLAGSSQRAREVIAQDMDGRTNAEIMIDFVGSSANTARVVSLLYRGEKRLVFCERRDRVEELTSQLRENGVTAYASHSSLSLDERRRSEEAFQNGRNCVIVATSTLELGVDVGDLDRVIQVNAPPTVSSFLQRLGRSGRRPGTMRNCLFLSEDDDSFLLAAALVALGQQGFVEPVVGPEKPYHVLAQQLLLLVRQQGAVGPDSWRRWFGRAAGFTGEVGERAPEIIEHMLRAGYLTRDGELLLCGCRGEDALGYRFLLRLLSVFETPKTYAVVHQRKRIGEVDELGFKQLLREGSDVLLLSGQAWAIVNIDWRRRIVEVVPEIAEGRSRWPGGGRFLSREISQAIRDILLSDDEPPWLSDRARTRLGRLREEHFWLRNASGVPLGFARNGSRRFWTFAGSKANLTLAAALGRELGQRLEHNHLWISGWSFCEESLRAAFCSMLRQKESICEAIPMDLLPELKFAELLPEMLVREQLLARLYDPSALELLT